MEHAVHAVRWCVEAVLCLLDRLPAWLSLAVIALVTALVMLVAIRRTTPQRLVARSRAQIGAALLEMRLYLDHPATMLRAQGRMLVWTVVYVGSLLPSLLVLAAPLGLLYLHLEPRHGLGPLAAPASVVLRVELAEDRSLDDVEILAAGADVAVTARVRAPGESAVYARIAIRSAASHTVLVRADDEEATKLLVAEPGAAVVAPERRAGLASGWALGPEPPLDGDAIRAISVVHPARDAAVPGPWWLYWLSLGTVFALALRRRFDVAL